LSPKEYVTEYPNLFSPVRIGSMQLKNRVMVPPHTALMGPLWGTQEQADQHVAYIRARAEAGVAWFDTITGHIDNLYAPGFDPVGVGARTKGYIRLPHFRDRIGQLTEAIHGAGSKLTIQLVSQGGLPNAPSSVLSTPMLNAVPHALTREEIAWYVKEFSWSAGESQAAGADGVEFHLNHDDILEWFMSPLTNRRDDEYGGNFENRMRIVMEILRESREITGDNFTIGVRLNMFEEMPGGYDLAGGIQIAQNLEASGLIDFVSLVVGSNWGNPSYIQSHAYAPGEWADMSGEFARALSLPVAYTGRVTTPELAEAIIAKGNAAVVGVARAVIADAEWVRKAEQGRADEIRPCTGCNDCISASLVEKLNLSCSVNPHVGTEVKVTWPVPVSAPRSVLVIGGGPAGMEVAALAAERGHRVEIWEKSDHLGGQLRTAVNAPTYEGFAEYLAWQERRLERVGVSVRTGQGATASDIVEANPDVVIIATGANPRYPDVEGVDRTNVHDMREVLDGTVTPGKRVLVIAQDDHMPPLAVADFLASAGHDVTVVYATNGPAPLLSRYMIGGILARLDNAGVKLRFSEIVTGVTDEGVQVRHAYSGRAELIRGIDSVVLACGGVPEASLYEELKGQHPRVHLLGDAFAPRRLLFATKQAYALASLLDD
jgi:2,4-dienoyl-CoA reductase-like NADH-dependent reductase (Old Yellow Enzyme family)/thioredoxin reductase